MLKGKKNRELLQRTDITRMKKIEVDIVFQQRLDVMGLDSSTVFVTPNLQEGIVPYVLECVESNVNLVQKWEFK